MADPFDYIPEDLKKEIVKSSEQEVKKEQKKSKEKKETQRQTTGKEKKQRGPFKRTRANVVLTRNEVKAIKSGRKKLRKEMRARGLKRKEDFELTAGSLGLYFDKKNNAFLLWLGRHWLASLLGMLFALLTVLFIFSLVQRMRGHFTVNLSDGMLEKGYSLFDNAELQNPTMQLFATPTENAPCISISQVPADVVDTDGQYPADNLMGYTFYLRNDGERDSSFKWSLDLVSEYKDLSEAARLVVFVDDEMTIYAKEGADGKVEALPEMSDTRHGYLHIPIMELSPDSEQFQIVATNHRINYYRVVPENFLTDETITAGRMTGVKPQEVHKFTVVLFLEGDDPECTDELVGGSMGVEMSFREDGEEESEDSSKSDNNGFFGYMQATLKRWFAGLKW